MTEVYWNGQRIGQPASSFYDRYLSPALKSLRGLFNSPIQQPMAPSPSPTPMPTPSVDQMRQAILYNETRGVPGDRYAFRQPSGSNLYGDALGAYQITEERLARQSPRYLGTQMAPQSFLQSPSSQDRFMTQSLTAALGKRDNWEQAILQHRFENPAAWDRPAAKRYLSGAMDYFKSQNIQAPRVK
jgi:hypothetical protein